MVADSIAANVRINRPVSEVFGVLCDPTSYPHWLVGAKRVVDIDSDWPAVGSAFRHRIGWGPLRIPGSTSVTRLVPDRLLQLSAGMGPLGEALVTFRLEQSAGSTLLSVDERPRRGIAGAFQRGARRVVAFALWGRNQASLEMLQELLTEPDDSANR